MANKLLPLLGGLALGGMALAYGGNAFAKDDKENTEEVDIDEDSVSGRFGMGVSTDFDNSYAIEFADMWANIELFEYKLKDGSKMKNRLEIQLSEVISNRGEVHSSLGYLIDLKRDITVYDKPTLVKEVSHLSLGPRLDFQWNSYSDHYLGTGLAISKGVYREPNNISKQVNKYLISVGASVGSLGLSKDSHSLGMALGIKGITEGRISKKLGIGFFGEFDAVIPFEKSQGTKGMISLNPYLKFITQKEDTINFGPIVRLVGDGKDNRLEAMLVLNCTK
ncbi:MAG: hypothetical protein ABIB71_02790 [Candidatus Woesearchaeota archaeon]